MAFSGLNNIHIKAQAYDIVWIDGVGVNISGSNITKTAGAAWGNAGAASEQVLPANTDGWIEMIAQEINTYRMFGLSATNTNNSYTSINYALFPAINGALRVYENGSNKGTFGTYSIGDKLRVERTGTTISYKKNGTVFYTSTASSSGQLIADVALYTNGATISNAVASFSATCDTDVDEDGVCAAQDCNDNDANFPMEPGTSCDDGDADTTNDVIQSDGCNCAGTVPGSKQEGDITWINGIGANISGNSITKTASTAWGNAGAASEQVLPANADGWIEMTAQTTNTNRMWGFSTTSTNNHYNTINYAIYLRIGGTLTVFENGSNKGNFGTYSIGDKLRVERTGTAISYKKNGTVIYTSTSSSSTQLIADVALHTTGATISNAKYCFGDGGDGGTTGSSVFVEHNANGAIRYSDGKVIIGASDTDIDVAGSYKLFVQGGIITELAKVSIRNSASWSDF